MTLDPIRLPMLMILEKDNIYSQTNLRRPSQRKAILQRELRRPSRKTLQTIRLCPHPWKSRQGRLCCRRRSTKFCP